MEAKGMLVRSVPGWFLRESEATPERVYFDRRDFIAKLAAAGVVASIGGRLGAEEKAPAATPAPKSGLYPATRNDAFKLDRPLTEEAVAARFNVFDEFSTDHSQVWKVAKDFVTSPWKVHIGGAVQQAITIDVEELSKTLGLEERLYRHRCVEAWAMAVPWTGFPFRKLVELAKPTAKAKFVRMLSFSCPQGPGWYATKRVFPYYEALSLEEATCDLTLLATGIYGHPLPPQHGAPLRLVTPWKWGLKSIKSIVAFEFTPERPGTFWNELSPAYYSFHSNVDPDNFPGPWSQKEETMLGTEEVRKTVKYNGYGEWVAKLYA
jgi:sulfoxide reductase catalytic subunit YedY